MSNFKVDNLEVNTINGNSISSLGGSSSAGATMTEYSSINSSSVQGTDFPEGKLTITEDTQIRKINVTTKNLDGKLTVGDTVFEGTKVDTSEDNGVEPTAENIVEVNVIDSRINNISAFNKVATTSGDPLYFHNTTDFITFKVESSTNVMGIINDGDSSDTYQNPVKFINIDTNEEIIGNDPTNEQVWQYLTTLSAGTWKIERYADKFYCANGIVCIQAGPSIPTITKEIQLDSTTIDMELDGTLDSVDYETFSGQDIDALSLVIDFITGDSTKQTEVINKLNKLKGE